MAIPTSKFRSADHIPMRLQQGLFLPKSYMDFNQRETSTSSRKVCVAISVPRIQSANHDTGKCLRCGKSRVYTLFCDFCQLTLLDRSLHKEEMHEIVPRSSLVPNSYATEQNVPGRTVQKFVGQPSLCVPAQQITCSRQLDSRKYVNFMQRDVQVMLQALSAQHRKLSCLCRMFALLVTLASLLLILNCIFVFLVSSHR